MLVSFKTLVLRSIYQQMNAINYNAINSREILLMFTVSSCGINICFLYIHKIYGFKNLQFQGVMNVVMDRKYIIVK